MYTGAHVLVVLSVLCSPPCSATELHHPLNQTHAAVMIDARSGGVCFVDASSGGGVSSTPLLEQGHNSGRRHAARGSRRGGGGGGASGSSSTMAIRISSVALSPSWPSLMMSCCGHVARGGTDGSRQRPRERAPTAAGALSLFCGLLCTPHPAPLSLHPLSLPCVLSPLLPLPSRVNCKTQRMSERGGGNRRPHDLNSESSPSAQLIAAAGSTALSRARHRLKATPLRQPSARLSSAAPPSTFSRCINSDGERASAK